ncbi:MAG: DoxX family membrane protein [Polyangiaceae bacterium]|nr:DoxX family membrane protein [Polyangiaceae bacterium]
MTRSERLERLTTLTSLALRVLLALVFIFAAYPKLADTRAFAEHVSYYDLLPQYSALVAVTIPALELVAAVAVLVAPHAWRSAALLVLFALLCMFTFAVAQAYLRGIDTECGCFGSGGERVGIPKLIENAGLIAAAVLAWLLDLRQNRAAALNPPR